MFLNKSSELWAKEAMQKIYHITEIKSYLEISELLDIQHKNPNLSLWQKSNENINEIFDNQKYTQTDDNLKYLKNAIINQDLSKAKLIYTRLPFKEKVRLAKLIKAISDRLTMEYLIKQLLLELS